MRLNVYETKVNVQEPTKQLKDASIFSLLPTAYSIQQTSTGIWWTYLFTSAQIIQTLDVGLLIGTLLISRSVFHPELFMCLTMKMFTQSNVQIIVVLFNRITFPPLSMTVHITLTNCCLNRTYQMSSNNCLMKTGNNLLLKP